MVVVVGAGLGGTYTVVGVVFVDPPPPECCVVGGDVGAVVGCVVGGDVRAVVGCVFGGDVGGTTTGPPLGDVTG